MWRKTIQEVADRIRACMLYLEGKFSVPIFSVFDFSALTKNCIFSFYFLRQVQPNKFALFIITDKW